MCYHYAVDLTWLLLSVCYHHTNQKLLADECYCKETKTGLHVLFEEMVKFTHLSPPLFYKIPIFTFDSLILELYK